MVFFEGCRIVYNENKRRTKFKEMEREKSNRQIIMRSDIKITPALCELE